MAEYSQGDPQLFVNARSIYDDHDDGDPAGYRTYVQPSSQGNTR